MDTVDLFLLFNFFNYYCLFIYFHSSLPKFTGELVDKDPIAITDDSHHPLFSV